MEKFDLENLINDFLEKTKKEKINIYSESNLEIRLAQHLMLNIPSDFKVENQRNVEDFGIDKHTVLKKEMDIVIYNQDKSIKYEIELKYPTTKRNRAYPDNLKKVIEDIKFTEELKEKGFTETYFLVISDDEKVYGITGPTGRDLTTEGIYEYFRAGKEINGNINDYEIKGHYTIKWKECGDIKYFLGKTNNEN